jgi:hypothetical protein
MEETLKQYVIRPIIRNKFSGQSYYNKTLTVIMGAQLSQNGLYKTGLSLADQEHFEKELNLTKGTLSARNGEFWGDMEVRLRNDKLTIFNIVNAYDELKFRMLQQHDWIANTEHDVQGNSTARFYIYDPEAASKIEDAKMEFEFAAIEAFSNATVEERRGLLRVFGKKGVDLMSETMVKTELYKQVKSDPKEFIRLATAKDTPVRALIEALIEKSILKKKGTYFYNGEDLLGSSTDEVVSYLSDLKNQAVKLALEGKLKPKKVKAE